jgi:hypothetical protein
MSNVHEILSKRLFNTSIFPFFGSEAAVLRIKNYRSIVLSKTFKKKTPPQYEGVFSNLYE